MFSYYKKSLEAENSGNYANILKIETDVFKINEWMYSDTQILFL